MAVITSEQELRALYTMPNERAVKKQIAALDRHCINFLALPVILLRIKTFGHYDGL